MKVITTILLSGILFLALLSSCKKDEHSIMLSESLITFSYTDNEATVIINSTSEDVLDYTLSSPSDAVTFSQSTGHCSKNSPGIFDIILNRGKIHSDSISTTVNVVCSNGETKYLSLFIHGYPENKIRYNNNITSAGYDLLHDRIIILSQTNSEYYLDLYDINLGSFKKIDLDEHYSSISVSPDGSYAIVYGTYNSHIAYIDLTEDKVINSFPLNNYWTSYVAGNDKCAYYISDYQILKINLVTGIPQAFSTNYLDPEMIAIHPSGDYIYGVGYDNFFKISLKSPSPEVVYNNNNLEMSGKLIISADGQKIFSGGKKVLNINSSAIGNDVTGSQDLNMSYNYTYLAAQNPEKNEFYVVPSYSNNQGDDYSDLILLFDNSLVQKGIINLEKFYIGSNYGAPTYTRVDPIARYLFVSRDGGRIIVLEQPQDYSNFWGIEIINRD